MSLAIRGVDIRHNVVSLRQYKQDLFPDGHNVWHTQHTYSQHARVQQRKARSVVKTYLSGVSH